MATFQQDWDDAIARQGSPLMDPIVSDLDSTGASIVAVTIVLQNGKKVDALAEMHQTWTVRFPDESAREWNKRREGAVDYFLNAATIFPQGQVIPPHQGPTNAPNSARTRIPRWDLGRIARYAVAILMLLLGVWAMYNLYEVYANAAAAKAAKIAHQKQQAAEAAAAAAAKAAKEKAANEAAAAAAATVRYPCPPPPNATEENLTYCTAQESKTSTPLSDAVRNQKPSASHVRRGNEIKIPIPLSNGRPDPAEQAGTTPPATAPLSPEPSRGAGDRKITVIRPAEQRDGDLSMSAICRHEGAQITDCAFSISNRGEPGILEIESGDGVSTGIAVPNFSDSVHIPLGAIRFGTGATWRETLDPRDKPRTLHLKFRDVGGMSTSVRINLALRWKGVDGSFNLPDIPILSPNS